jgi:hypothetical protein
MGAKEEVRTYVMRISFTCLTSHCICFSECIIRIISKFPFSKPNAASFLFRKITSESIWNLRPQAYLEHTHRIEKKILWDYAENLKP